MNDMQEDARFEEEVEGIDGALAEIAAQLLEEEQWLKLARNAYTQSTTYMDTNVFPQWSKNLAHFRNEHAPGSKYLREAYRLRSKGFRPKTRSTIQAHVAKMAAAAFSSGDLLSAQANNMADPKQAASAAVGKALLQYRLERTIPWFMTVLGAYQDTHLNGICISHQYWDYAAKQDKEIVPAMDEAGNPVLDEETGEMLGEEVVNDTILFDQPEIDLVSPEDFRFSPTADWRDPVNTSPYLIHEFPMTVGDVLERMESGAWREYNMASIMTHGRSDEDGNKEGVQRARDGRGRTDPDDAHEYDEFATVVPRRNIIRKSGIDWDFWTLGSLLLSEPVPLAETSAYAEKTGKRPYAVGVSNIEAHRPIPAATAEIMAPMQEAINDIANQRDDNVKLVLNKRYHVRRGAQVDVRSLLRNVPGGAVMMDNPDSDVNVVSTPDVTSSAYQEQDRLAVELDELSGHFSQSSVQNNRAMNETVGGMSMMQNGANDVQELYIRTFVETWMEPVLNQLMILEQCYETDEVILGIAGGKAELFDKFGVDAITDDLLAQGITITVNVGMGAVNPFQKIQRLTTGLNSVMALPGMAEKAKSEEIAAEVFGHLGYQDGKRFFMSDEEMQQKMQNQQPQQDPQLQIAQMRIESDKYRVDREYEARMADAQMEHEGRMADIASRENMTMAQLERKLGLDQYALKTKRDIAALQETNKTNELNYKRETGKQGI